MTYDPRSAVAMFRRAMQAKQANPSSMLPRIVDERGKVQGIEVVCFFLLEWITDGLSGLPDDLANLPTSSSALKQHTRPDGGTFLGLYEAPNEVGAGVVVFGDPSMSEKQIAQYVKQFRLHHAKQAVNLNTGPAPKLIS